ncbi:MAG TPA: plastocyanin/azurin family copper-binding protein [Candidatus Limnocylindrales bacterium]|nr:plastocyanin/azurin family copper-binding protein [Candidatus Limnocylindrales bacterium]
MTSLRRAARWSFLAIAVVGLAMVLAACSGSGSGGGGASAAPVSTSTVDLPPSYKFVPAAITVTAGTTVTWNNRDNFTHSVQFKDGGLPTDPQMMKPGESTTFTFTTAGTFHYQCSLHPQQMQGTVTVTQ